MASEATSISVRRITRQIDSPSQESLSEEAQDASRYPQVSIQENTEAGADVCVVEATACYIDFSGQVDFLLLCSSPSEVAPPQLEKGTERDSSVTDVLARFFCFCCWEGRREWRVPMHHNPGPTYALTSYGHINIQQLPRVHTWYANEADLG